MWRIARCTLQLTVPQLTTNGSNIPGLWQFACSDTEGLIDPSTIYSNDIYAILCTYGVEAARAAILREVGGVFDVYKIDVDSRHLELIADYMVSEHCLRNVRILTSRPDI